MRIDNIDKMVSMMENTDKDKALERIEYYKNVLKDASQLTPVEIDTYEWFLDKWENAYRELLVTEIKQQIEDGTVEYVD